MSLRALLGWTPVQIVTPLPDGSSRVTVEASEWDYTERNLALALDEIDAQTCPGCGGDLSVELTDKHPAEDDGGGHYHQAKPYWCRLCVSNEKLRRRVSKEDEALHGTSADPYPTARRYGWSRLPIPTATT